MPYNYNNLLESETQYNKPHFNLFSLISWLNFYENGGINTVKISAGDFTNIYIFLLLLVNSNKT